MILDVRTMYIAMGAICFTVAAALFTFRTRRSRQDGTLQWALGWSLQGASWVLVGLRGIAGDFLSIVVGQTCLIASYSLLYAAVSQFQGRSYKRGILLIPAAATFIFFWYFSVHVDNLVYRVVFISLLSMLQIGAIVGALLYNALLKERRPYWLTGFAFLMMALVWLNRLIEGLTLSFGQLSVLQATAFRNASVVTLLGAAVLSSIGFVLMIRERAEEALRRSEERYRSLFSGMTEGFALHEIICDEKGEPCDYRFLEINPAFERLTGLKRDDVIGRTVNEVLPDNEPYWVKTYGAVALTGRPVQFQNYSSPLNKHYEVFAYCPAPRQFAVIFMDITERKRVEEEIRHKEEELRKAQGITHIGSWYWDALTDATTGSDELLRIYGLDPATEAMPPFREQDGRLYPHDSWQKVNAGVQGTLETGVGYELDVEAIRDGAKIWVTTRSEVVRDINGQIVGLRGTVQDITERKQAEEALRKARDELETRVKERTRELQQAYDRLKEETGERRQIEQQLRQAQKMEALGTLSGGIAHDFNNILAAIIGFTELVAGNAVKGSRDERHLARVMEASIRGRELVQQMLTFSRKTEQEKKPLHLDAIVKETVKLIRATIPATIGIRINSSGVSDMILGDPTQMQQVLMNLCTNASHAMLESGGTLDIGLSDHSASPSDGDPHGLKPGPYVKLTVRDTGIGMSADIMDKIFDPFFTTKKLGEGTGLGLSVVHGIVKQHDGSITVASEPGRGSIFTVYLPRIAATHRPDAVFDDEIPTGSERILFVDDEEALVEMGEDILAELGYEATARMNGQEALALFKSDPSRFDLVITDQTMPEMTGVELAEEILALRADMPIVMCTGYSQLVDANKARAAGIKAFAMKPLTKREIAKTIRKVLDE